jgi:hypothetical protein
MNNICILVLNSTDKCILKEKETASLKKKDILGLDMYISLLAADLKRGACVHSSHPEQRIEKI